MFAFSTEIGARAREKNENLISEQHIHTKVKIYVL